MAYKVYLSPSVQHANLYASGLGTEAQHMQAVGEEVYRLLQLNGLSVFKNLPSMALGEIVRESNRLAVDAHVAIHSNTGGGTGAEIWYFSNSVKGRKLAQAIYEPLSLLTPTPDRGLKPSTLFYELRETKAPAVIVEVAFHDNPVEAQWIISRRKDLAVVIANGICNYFGLPFIPEKSLDVNLVVDGAPYTPKISPVMREGRVLIGIRDAATIFGGSVHWDGATRTVFIRTRK